MHKSSSYSWKMYLGIAKSSNLKSGIMLKIILLSTLSMHETVYIVLTKLQPQKGHVQMLLNS